MSDLINRQAAIDAVNKIAPVNAEYDCTLLDILDVRYVLTELPSAEPEIIRCKDCKYWQDNNGGYFNDECRWWNEETPEPDDFCSYAERRGEQE